MMGLISELLGRRTSFAKFLRAQQQIKDCRETLRQIIGVGAIIDPAFEQEAEKLDAALDDLCARLQARITPQWWENMETAIATQRALKAQKRMEQPRM
jgi:hypothetical protein